MAWITQRFLVPVSTVSALNAWHNDPLLCPKYDELKNALQIIISLATNASETNNNNNKENIEHQSVSVLYRMCGKCQENCVEHIVSGRSKLAQRNYKKRHHTQNRVVHSEICKVYDLPHTSKWYEHNRNNNSLHHRHCGTWRR